VCCRQPGPFLYSVTNFSIPIVIETGLKNRIES
jgi:hypothetical protein